jgi:hypothetical protein
MVNPIASFESPAEHSTRPAKIGLTRPPCRLAFRGDGEPPLKRMRQIFRNLAGAAALVGTRRTAQSGGSETQAQ